MSCQHLTFDMEDFLYEITNFDSGFELFFISF